MRNEEVQRFLNLVSDTTVGNIYSTGREWQAKATIYAAEIVAESINNLAEAIKEFKNNGEKEENR